MTVGLLGERQTHQRQERSGEKRGETRLQVTLWAAGMLVATLVGALIPLLFRARFYFAGDTQSGAFGQWYHLGSQLLDGIWPLMQPDHWHAGNYVVEGQWGLWNPVVLLIGVLAFKSADAVVFVTVLKVTTLVIASGGGFLLLRSFGARASSSALFGLAITLTGFTVYMDAASWVTGLMTWALWPYVWWGARRVAQGRNPWPVLVAGYLLVTVGYVHATIMVAITFAAVLVEALFVRRWKAAALVTAAGALVGLVVFTVFLPPLLSASVTNRATDVYNSVKLTTNGGDLLTAALPTGMRSMFVFGGNHALAPLPYIAWFLPLLFLVDFSRFRRRAGDFVGVAFVLAGALVLTLAPAVVGPLRFPVRVLPYVATTILLLAVVALDRGLLRPPGKRRGLYAVIAAVAPAYLSVAQAPLRWRVPMTSALLVGLLVALVWLWVQRRPASGPLRFTHGRLMAALMVGTLAVTVVQHRVVPRSPLAELYLPAKVSAYEEVLQNAPGDAMLVGDPLPPQHLRRRHGEDVWKHMMLANAWYVGTESVLNTYTPVGFKAFKERFCINFQGATCDRGLTALFRHPDDSFVPRVDLMSISTVIISKRHGGVTPLRFFPVGWHVAENDATHTVWKRDTPLPHAGGVTYTSPGMKVSDVHWDDLTATFHVDATPGDGSGEVTLSRLPWPGYQVTNGSLAKPLDDYLLTVSVPDSSAGKTVTVHYQPPGWPVSTAFWGIALALGTLWSLVHGILLLRRRRRSRAEAVPETETEAGAG